MLPATTPQGELDAHAERGSAVRSYPTAFTVGVGLIEGLGGIPAFAVSWPDLLDCSDRVSDAGNPDSANTLAEQALPTAHSELVRPLYLSRF